jgi:pyruvate formate lyase activating enzyme
VLSQIELDRPFYNRSGGGVTLGGGEPLAQFDFTLELLKNCKKRFLHTALETCGQAPWQQIKQVAEYLDLVYFDIKLMDPQKHKEFTGVANGLILANARRVLSGEVTCEVIVRTEVIPGCNDTEEAIAAIAKFVAEASGQKMELLPYHALGSGKYRQLGMPYQLTEIRPPSDERMAELRKIVESFGLKEMTGVY